MDSNPATVEASRRYRWPEPARLRRGAGVLSAALLLTACGGNQSASAKRMNARFDALDYTMATQDETNAAAYNQPLLDKASQQYAALVRKYAKQLGPKEARRRLEAKADEVAPFCLPCAGQLRDEAARY